MADMASALDCGEQRDVDLPMLKEVWHLLAKSG